MVFGYSQLGRRPLVRAPTHQNAPMVAELYDIISAMRTTLELDDGLMDALMARSKGKSKTKAVETAITDYLRRDAARGIRRLRGKITFEDPDYWRKSRQAELSQR